MDSFNRNSQFGQPLKKNKTPLQKMAGAFSDKNLRSGKVISLTATLFSGIFLFAENLKRFITSRLFWGRSTLYKNITHSFMLIITLVLAVSGLVYQLRLSNTETNLTLGNINPGSEDLLYQGSSIETVLVQNPGLSGIQTTKYKVKSGDTLQSIARKYGISADTIRWASSDVMSPFTDFLEPGWIVTIPNMNGVLYKVKPGQTLAQIIAEVSITNTEANRFNIIEFNALSEPVRLRAGQLLFIPDGNLKPQLAEGSIDIPRGVFIDPLSHPTCKGYNYSRGYTGYHDGVDLAKWNGCRISAVANAVVLYAGWQSQGQGYMVELDHGGGIVTKYFHGNGTYYVKTGDRISQGQSLMQMGCTGYCTGTHLHFSLWKDGISVNPFGYIPYNF